MPRLLPPFHLLLHCSWPENQDHLVDSAKLAVCHNGRIRWNRVFQGLTQRDDTTMGWFFGFKLRLLINHQGQTMAVKVTGSNTDDRQPLERLTTALGGKAVNDKGYSPP